MLMVGALKEMRLIFANNVLMASDSFVYRLGNGDEEGRRAAWRRGTERAELSSGLMLGVVVEFAARSIPNTHFFWFVISIIDSSYYLFNVDFFFHERRLYSIALPLIPQAQIFLTIYRAVYCTLTICASADLPTPCCNAICTLMVVHLQTVSSGVCHLNQGIVQSYSCRLHHQT
jgi:hypothetical protein